MQPKHLYEYAIVRVVPAVEREEFVNVGVILLCKREKMVKMQYILPTEKILALQPDCDLEVVRAHLEAFRQLAAGEKGPNPIADLSAAERFRWLTAVRSATIQTSRPHPGISADLEQTLQKLFNLMVG